MDKKWYLVVYSEETYERNNRTRSDDYSYKYELSESLAFRFPGHSEKSYIRSVAFDNGGARAVLVKPIEYEVNITSDEPYYTSYSDYRESCGDGITESYRIRVTLELL